LSLASELTQPPESVQPSDAVLALLCYLRQGRNRILPPVRERELGLLSHPHVDVFEQFRQLFVRAFAEPLRKQHLRLGDGRILRGIGSGETINPALAGESPAVDPVADIEAAIGTELAIGRENAAERFMSIDRLERGAPWLHRE